MVKYFLIPLLMQHSTLLHFPAWGRRDRLAGCKVGGVPPNTNSPGTATPALRTTVSRY